MGALDGAASGASAGAALGPWGAAAGGILGGAIGLFTAKKRAAEAKRQAAYNNELARNDTAFGAFNKTLDRGHQVGSVSDSGPSALGGALQGALAGAQQGMNIYDGMRKKSGGQSLGTPAEAGLDATGALHNLQAGGTVDGAFNPDNGNNPYASLLKLRGMVG